MLGISFQIKEIHQVPKWTVASIFLLTFRTTSAINLTFFPSQACSFFNCSLWLWHLVFSSSLEWNRPMNQSIVFFFPHILFGDEIDMFSRSWSFVFWAFLRPGLQFLLALCSFENCVHASGQMLPGLVVFGFLWVPQTV